MNQRVAPESLSSMTISEDDEIAALEFEPWTHREDEWTPPTNREWCEAVNPTLVAIRMAWISLYKTKPELVSMLGELNKESKDDDDNLAIVLLESILAAQDRISGIKTVLDCAAARLMIAGMNI